MKYAVIYSKKDEAGMNIAEHLKEFYLPQVKIIEVKKDSVFCDNIDKEENLENFDFIIFATKHQSKAGEKSLSLHAPGNWRNADFGGKPGKICKTSALALKYLFKKLEENAKLAEYKHNITLECTHHGPLIEKPCCFIELGSSEEGWKDKDGARIVAKTIADFQNFKEDNKIKSVIGIGGPHYCPNFNKVQLNSNEYAISHIIPEYALPINETMITEAIEKTKEHTEKVIVDWKGCGNSESRNKVIDVIKKLGLEYERTERIEK
jgi:D-aminoacyl-tRNA deacylase